MIEIKNVNKWYGNFQVLTDCSTSVKKGEVVVVCGPSGSGKSTELRAFPAYECLGQSHHRPDKSGPLCQDNMQRV